MALLYLTRALYSPDAYKGLIAKPEDRTAAVKAIYEAVGGKLHHMWFSAETREVFMVGELEPGPRGVSSLIVTMASGTITDISSTYLLTAPEMAEAARNAAAVVAKFRPAGK